MITAKPRAAAPPLGGPAAAEQMPPFSLPGEHFAAALMWLALSGAGLVVVAPLLAGGAFLTPRVIAVTHGFTLGWITTSIFGALYQLFPVTLGVSARSERVAHLTFLTLQAGVVLLVAGAWWWQPWMLAAGWLALFAAVGGLSWNLLPQRRRAPRGRTIGLYVSAAHVALGLAMFVVAARIGQALGWWPVSRLGILGAHAHLAVLGFATLTVVGVGSRLLPMFLLSRGHSEWALRWIGWLVLGGTTAYGIGAIAGFRPLALSAGAVTAAGVALYLYQAASYFRCRTRKALDPGMAHAALGLGFLAAALAVGLVLLVQGAPQPDWVTAYGVLGIGGWLTVFVVGLYYKVVPFLTWLHRFSPRVGEPGLPKVADLTVPWLGWTTLALLGAGVTALALGSAVRSEPATVTGAWLAAAGFWVVSAQHAWMWWKTGNANSRESGTGNRESSTAGNREWGIGNRTARRIPDSRFPIPESRR